MAARDENEDEFNAFVVAETRLAAAVIAPGTRTRTR